MSAEEAGAEPAPHAQQTDRHEASPHPSTSDPQFPNGRRLLAASRRFEGPVPPPDLIAEYERVIDDAGERFMRMAEAEQRHRHAADDRDQDLARRGQTLAALCFGGVLVVALALGLTGHEWPAAVVAAMDLGAFALIYRATRG